MFVKTARPLAVAALALFVTATGAGTASAATATPVVGSVSICTGIPVGPLTISVCL
ncbi:MULTISPECIES: hypothetical protein [Nocardia]|uniref:Small secreted domain DUF320 n=2 Tax=Nocardia TaxID=1817 RepID=A0A4R6P005_NOCIG|nr:MULTISPECIES: hypothetical protein [Nocardia]NKX91148.1 hypothetical protein [Nocardia coubleae]TDP30701.1 hypothetical protein DFR75_111166 [Nocardia ignorata]